MVTERQAAAIRRKKRNEAIDRDEAFQRKVTGPLMGFEDADPVDPSTVGWYQPAGWSVKGINHVCRDCQPTRPLGFQAVPRNLLAARMPCTRCGKALETVGLPAV